MNDSSKVAVALDCNPLAQRSASVPASTTVAQSPRHFAFVDALRGCAILGVLLVHAAHQVQNPASRLVRLADAGQYGVQLFFVVSAFTLFWSLHSRFHVDRKPFRAFFVRRLFRVAPLFWCGIAFYLLWPCPWRSFTAPEGIGPLQILTTLFFVHGWHPATINSIVPGGWSIADEMMFYLCVPALYFFIANRKRSLQLTVVAGILAIVLSKAAELFLMPRFPSSWGALVLSWLHMWLPAQLPVFCVGIALYFFIRRDREDVRADNPSGGAISRLERVFGNPRNLLLASLLVMCIPLGVKAYLRFAFAFFLLALGLSRYPLPLLVNRYIKYLGTISYSIYIWHFFIRDWISLAVARHIAALPHLSPAGSALLQFAALFTAITALTVPIAALSYHFIELPAQRLGKKLISKMGWDGAPLCAHPAAASETASSREDIVSPLRAAMPRPCENLLKLS